MATLDELLDAIAAAPPGPQVAAFFDYDGTVIDGFSASAFYRHRLRHCEIGPVELAKTLLGAARGIDSGEDFEEFLKMALGAWRGRSEEEIDGDRRAAVQARDRRAHALGGVAARRGAPRDGPPRRARVVGDALPGRADGARAGGRPRALHAGRGHRRHASPAAPPGRCCGARARRARRARSRAEHDLDIDECFAYSNGAEDVPFLEAAGHPVVRRPRVRRWCAWRTSAAGRSCAARRARARRGRSTSRGPSASTARWRRAGYAGAAIGLLRPLAQDDGRRHRRRGLGPRPRGRGHRRRRRRGHRAPVVGAAVRVRLQPPEQARHDRRREAAAQRLHRRREEGGRQRARASASSSGWPASRSSTASNPAKAREALDAGGRTSCATRARRS